MWGDNELEADSKKRQSITQKLFTPFRDREQRGE